MLLMLYCFYRLKYLRNYQLCLEALILLYNVYTIISSWPITDYNYHMVFFIIVYLSKLYLDKRTSVIKRQSACPVPRLITDQSSLIRFYSQVIQYFHSSLCHFPITYNEYAIWSWNVHSNKWCLLMLPRNKLHFRS